MSNQRDLDASRSAVGIESIKIEHEGIISDKSTPKLVVDSRGSDGADAAKWDGPDLDASKNEVVSATLEADGKFGPATEAAVGATGVNVNEQQGPDGLVAGDLDHEIGESASGGGSGDGPGAGEPLPITVKVEIEGVVDGNTGGEPLPFIMNSGQIEPRGFTVEIAGHGLTENGGERSGDPFRVSGTLDYKEGDANGSSSLVGDFDGDVDVDARDFLVARGASGPEGGTDLASLGFNPKEIGVEPRGVGSASTDGDHWGNFNFKPEAQGGETDSDSAESDEPFSRNFEEIKGANRPEIAGEQAAVDGSDFLAWQGSVVAEPDGDVDGADFLAARTGLREPGLGWSTSGDADDRPTEEIAFIVGEAPASTPPTEQVSLNFEEVRATQPAAEDTGSSPLGWSTAGGQAGAGEGVASSPPPTEQVSLNFEEVRATPPAADGDVDGADFLAARAAFGAQTPDALKFDTEVVDFAQGAEEDGDVDGNDFLAARGALGPQQPDPWKVQVETLEFAVADDAGLPQPDALKAGASEVLMESVSIQSPRDSASGQATGLAGDSDSDGGALGIVFDTSTQRSDGDLDDGPTTLLGDVPVHGAENAPGADHQGIALDTWEHGIDDELAEPEFDL